MTTQPASSFKPNPAAWSPFRHVAYRRLWIASVAANTGAWIYSAAAAWMMTIFDVGPLMVSLVQVATSLPMFLFALPAGALADIVDKRRFILVLEIMVAAIGGLFALLVSTGIATPWILLLFTFAIGIVEALEAPSWQSVVPELVPKEELAPAIAANSVGINISRAIGPALAGVIIVGLGIAAPFWFVAVSNFGVIGVFWWWKPPPTQRQSLPSERITSAIQIGFRYARNNHILRATLARSVGFFLFASAYWALLPLLARYQIGGGPELYGILLGAIGLGAVSGAFVLPQLKTKIGTNRLVALGEAGTAVALALFGFAHEPIMATLASFIAGSCWIAVLASLNVSAQKSLPDWVRGRGLAMFVTVFFGAMTLGSAVWGTLSEIIGLPATHFAAALGAISAIPLTSHWRLHTDASIDLTPSMHWPDPVISEAVENDAGPVMVTVEYRIDVKNRGAFLRSIEGLAAERKRDGAYAWGIFQDTADDGRFVETFLLESWAEHLRQHQRVTKADRLLERNVRKYLRGPPKTTHYIAAEAGDRQ